MKQVEYKVTCFIRYSAGGEIGQSYSYNSPEDQMAGAKEMSLRGTLDWLGAPKPIERIELHTEIVELLYVRSSAGLVLCSCSQK
jgi:hypothetical protein